jgi:divinyl protochlorophyllide a 8-vinyl-reductase
MRREAIAGAHIGPNAVLQMLPPLERRLGSDGLASLLSRAGVARPSGNEMIEEGDALALHRAVAETLPDEVEAIQSEAGAATAAYIMAHRIPWQARVALRLLPAPLAARILAQAIAQHSWTFAGSADFALFTGPRGRPAAFELRGNPFALAGRPCAWHRAVFDTLMRKLASPRIRVVETACCGAGAPACRFELGRSAGSDLADGRR